MSEPRRAGFPSSFLRAEKEQRAVEVRAKFDAVLLDFADFGEAEDLEAAAVGQDRPVPAP